MPTGVLAGGPGRLVRSWYEVVVGPRAFFAEVNERERGQRRALGFFAVVLLIGRLPGLAVGRGPLGIAAMAAILLLLSPVVLHVLTGAQYLVLWLVTTEDEGVDRTLRALAYGSAPGVLAAAPFLGVASFVGLYPVTVGLAEGHGIPRWRAAAAAAGPALLLFGLVFGGFEDGLAVWRLVVAGG